MLLKVRMCLYSVVRVVRWLLCLGKNGGSSNRDPRVGR